MNPLPCLHFKKNGSGKPVVILHGLFGMSDNWQSFAVRLAENGNTVYTVDLRNHGRSFHHPAFSIETMAGDLDLLFNKENISNPVIIGHSLGGKVAMYFALQSTGRVSGIIVIDIAPRAYEPHHTNVLSALKSIDFTVVRTRKQVQNLLSIHALDSATVQFLLKNLYWKNESTLDWRFNLSAIEKNINEAGKQITYVHPCLTAAMFIRGEHSSYILEEDLPEIKKLFPEAQILTAPGAGHWVHADNPGWLLETTVKFLHS